MSEARTRTNEIDDIITEFEHVDDPDVFERMKTIPALRMALEMKRPENWWGTGLNPKVLFGIARDDGIPVVSIPSSAVLLALAGAPDRNARMFVLLARRWEIVGDCKMVICHCDDPWLADTCMFTRKAVAAYEDGHQEAAMALAVSIGESLAIWASTSRCQAFGSEAEREAWERSRKNEGKYGWAKLELSDARADLLYPHDWRYKALIAPIPRFFTKWFPNSGQKPPNGLSRHVVAHQPTQQHFSPENALLSLMLATSLLHAMQKWSEVARSMEGE